MTIFRYKLNGLLYTLTVNSCGKVYKAHPYNHNVEIGVMWKNRFRDFKHNMSLADFVVVSEQ